MGNRSSVPSVIKLTLEGKVVGFAEAPQPARVLIIDGRNSHDWVTTTQSLAATLRATGRFEVMIETTPQLALPPEPRSAQSDVDRADLDAAKQAWRESTEAARQEFHEKTWAAWSPDFASAGTVILNYNGPDWLEASRAALVEYV